MEKELNLLEEFLILEKKKGRQENLSENERKTINERIDSLIKISRIVNAAEKALPEEDGKKLAYVAERLLEDSASAHLETDADGKIEMTVLDSIFRPKVLAKLELQKVDECLFFTGFRCH